MIAIIVDPVDAEVSDGVKRDQQNQTQCFFVTEYGCSAMYYFLSASRFHRKTERQPPLNKVKRENLLYCHLKRGQLYYGFVIIYYKILKK